MGEWGGGRGVPALQAECAPDAHRGETGAWRRSERDRGRRNEQRGYNASEKYFICTTTSCECCRAYRSPLHVRRETCKRWVFHRLRRRSQCWRTTPPASLDTRCASPLPPSFCARSARQIFFFCRRRRSFLSVNSRRTPRQTTIW